MTNEEMEFIKHFRKRSVEICAEVRIHEQNQTDPSQAYNEYSNLAEKISALIQKYGMQQFQIECENLKFED